MDVKLDIKMTDAANARPMKEPSIVQSEASRHTLFFLAADKLRDKLPVSLQQEFDELLSPKNLAHCFGYQSGNVQIVRRRNDTRLPSMPPAVPTQIQRSSLDIVSAITTPSTLVDEVFDDRQTDLLYRERGVDTTLRENSQQALSQREPMSSEDADQHFDQIVAQLHHRRSVPDKLQEFSAAPPSYSSFFLNDPSHNSVLHDSHQSVVDDQQESQSKDKEGALDTTQHTQIDEKMKSRKENKVEVITVLSEDSADADDSAAEALSSAHAMNQTLDGNLQALQDAQNREQARADRAKRNARVQFVSTASDTPDTRAKSAFNMLSSRNKSTPLGSFQNLHESMNSTRRKYKHSVSKDDRPLFPGFELATADTPKSDLPVFTAKPNFHATLLPAQQSHHTPDVNLASVTDRNQDSIFTPSDDRPLDEVLRQARQGIINRRYAKSPYKAGGSGGSSGDQSDTASGSNKGNDSPADDTSNSLGGDANTVVLSSRKIIKLAFVHPFLDYGFMHLTIALDALRDPQNPQALRKNWRNTVFRDVLLRALSNISEHCEHETEFDNLLQFFSADSLRDNISFLTVELIERHFDTVPNCTEYNIPDIGIEQGLLQLIRDRGNAPTEYHGVYFFQGEALKEVHAMIFGGRIACTSSKARH